MPTDPASPSSHRVAECGWPGALIFWDSYCLSGALSGQVGFLINLFIRSAGSIDDVGLFQGANSITNQYMGMLFSVLAPRLLPAPVGLLLRQSRAARGGQPADGDSDAHCHSARAAAHPHRPPYNPPVAHRPLFGHQPPHAMDGYWIAHSGAHISVGLHLCGQGRPQSLPMDRMCVGQSALARVQRGVLSSPRAHRPWHRLCGKRSDRHCGQLHRVPP